MLYRDLTALTIVVLLFAGQVWAEDQPADIENAKTPLTLEQLLPGGSIESVDLDYWTKNQMLTKTGGQTNGRETYVHITIKPKDGHLVFSKTRYFEANTLFKIMTRLEYTADSELQSYQGTTRRGEAIIASVTGQVEQDNLVISRFTHVNSEKPERPKTTTKIPAKEYASAVPSQWLPLVYAYHIRKGHLGYRVVVYDFAESRIAKTMEVMDLGTEDVERDGETVTAHLLSAKIKYGPGPRARRDQLRLLVLESGQVIWLEQQMPGSQSVGEHVTPQAVQEVFGDILKRDPPEEPGI